MERSNLSDPYCTRSLACEPFGKRQVLFALANLECPTHKQRAKEIIDRWPKLWPKILAATHWALSDQVRVNDWLADPATTLGVETIEPGLDGVDWQVEIRGVQDGTTIRLPLVFVRSRFAGGQASFEDAE